MPPLAKAKPGLSWLRLTLFLRSRRGADFKELVSELEARISPDMEPSDALFLAQHLLNTAQSGMQVGEVLVMHNRLRAVFERDGADARWRRHAWPRTRPGKRILPSSLVATASEKSTIVK